MSVQQLLEKERQLAEYHCRRLVKMVVSAFYGDIEMAVVNALLSFRRHVREADVAERINLHVTQVRHALAGLKKHAIIQARLPQEEKKSRKRKASEAATTERQRMQQEMKRLSNSEWFINFEFFVKALQYRARAMLDQLNSQETYREFRCPNEQCVKYKKKYDELQWSMNFGMDGIARCPKLEGGCGTELVPVGDVDQEKTKKQQKERFNHQLGPIFKQLSKVEELLRRQAELAAAEAARAQEQGQGQTLTASSSYMRRAGSSSSSSSSADTAVKEQKVEVQLPDQEDESLLPDAQADALALAQSRSVKVESTLPWLQRTAEEQAALDKKRALLRKQREEQKEKDLRALQEAEEREVKRQKKFLLQKMLEDQQRDKTKEDAKDEEVLPLVPPDQAEPSFKVQGKDYPLSQLSEELFEAMTKQEYSVYSQWLTDQGTEELITMGYL